MNRIPPKSTTVERSNHKYSELVYQFDEEGNQSLVRQEKPHPLDEVKFDDFNLKTLMRNHATELLKPSKPINVGELHNARSIETHSETLLSNRAKLKVKEEPIQTE